MTEHLSELSVVSLRHLDHGAARVDLGVLSAVCLVGIFTVVDSIKFDLPDFKGSEWLRIVVGIGDDWQLVH